MAIKLGIAGIGGRMGCRIAALALADSAFEVVAGLESQSSDHIGSPVGSLEGCNAGEVTISDRSDAEMDVLIEFSSPEGTAQWLETCQSRGIPIVIGTTGHDAQQNSLIEKASATIPVLKAPNMSIGVNVMLKVAEMLAKMLDASYDVEITEAHHRYKVDSPSGTAKALLDAVVEGRTMADGIDASVVYGRRGATGLRTPGEIGVHSLRIGDTVGRHSVAFGTIGESLTLTHNASDRDAFARGALLAARWIVGKPPELYGMSDVLG